MHKRNSHTAAKNKKDSMEEMARGLVMAMGLSKAVRTSWEETTYVKNLVAELKQRPPEEVMAFLQAFRVELMRPVLNTLKGIFWELNYAEEG